MSGHGRLLFAIGLCFWLALTPAAWAEIVTSHATTPVWQRIDQPISSTPLDDRYVSSLSPQGAVQSTLLNQPYDESWDSLRTFDFRSHHQTVVRVYVDTPAANSSFRPEYAHYVVDGMEQWSAALQGRLKYQLVDNPRLAQIRVYWVPGFREADQAGETETRIGDATVWIKTSGLPDNIIHGNILHELGHALGILGHSHHNHDIMRSGREWTSWTEYRQYRARLSSVDIAAIQHLYSEGWQPGEDLYRAIRQKRPAPGTFPSQVASGQRQKPLQP